MYISEHYLEEMFDMKSAKGFYEYYPKEEFQKNFEGIKNLYNEGKYRLLAKQLGVLFEPTLNYLVNYSKPRTPFLDSLVKKETSDEVLAHLAVAFILDAYTEDTSFIYGDTEVVEALNYFEFHELDDRENIRAYYEFVELPEANMCVFDNVKKDKQNTDYNALFEEFRTLGMNDLDRTEEIITEITKAMEDSPDDETIKATYDAMNKHLDTMMYELCNLTDEEIAMVEGGGVDGKAMEMGGYP